MVERLLFPAILLCLLCPLTSFQQSSNDSPARASPIVISGGTQGSSCPSSQDIQDRLEVSKTEIRETISSRQSDLSPGTCGGTGWIRVALLNMTDPSEQCPTSLQYIASPVRACGQLQRDRNTCDSVTFSTGGHTYYKVCGRVLAYQRGLTQAFYPSIVGGNTSIELNYVEGVSLTHGQPGARQHIWTFASAVGENDTPYSPSTRCPCTNTQYRWPYQVPAFIENNYFCETGNDGPGFSYTDFLTSDPLWDGEGCGANSTCCQFNNPPWFRSTLPQATNDDVEMRVCHAYHTAYQDTAIYLVELYVK